MKKQTYLLLLLIAPSAVVFAQWNPNGAHIYNTNSGNIGIGLNSPVGHLHISGSDSWSSHNYGAALVIDGPRNNAIAILDGGSSNPLALANVGGNFTISRMPPLGNTSQLPGQLLTIQPSGNTGIGTITPGGRLHLYDAPYWSTHNYGPSLVIDGPHNNAIAILDAGSSNPIALANVGGNFVISKMPALGNTAVNPLPLITVNPNGNVGLGTEVPQSSLDVRKRDGSEGLTATIASFTLGGQNHFSSGEGKLVFGSEAYTNGIQRRSEIGFALSGWNGGGALKFYTTPNDETYTPLARMIIDHAGNVGIGTITPDAKLTVKGDIHTREVRVDMTGPLQGPDYVFEKDYDLLPLAELEAYINQNKHLPEVPSAKEMEANGLNLKEMNLLLLKKVEELTLHLIEQDKKIAALQENSRRKNARKKR